MREVFDTLNQTIYTFNPQGGVTWAIAFEPLVSGMLKNPKDRNVLGLKTVEDGYSITPWERNAWGLTDVFVVVLISALWPNSTADSSVESTARSVLSSWKREARAKGLLQGFTYLNYAAPYQDPLKSLSKEERRFLEMTSKNYDPEQVLQRKVGGFKL